MGQGGRVALEMFVRVKPLITIQTMERDASPFGSALDRVGLFEDLGLIAASPRKPTNMPESSSSQADFSNQECTELGQFRSEGLIE